MLHTCAKRNFKGLCTTLRVYILEKKIGKGSQEYRSHTEN